MKILVVVDMQEDFISGSLGTKEAQTIVPKVVQRIDGFDGRLAVTYDTHDDGYLSTQEGRRLPVPHCAHLSDGWKLHKDVLEAIEKQAAVQGGQPAVFQKAAFGSVGLAEWLARMDREHGLEEVTLIGLCTDICVISNAMVIKAFLPEVPIVVDASCCAGVTPESHANALAAMEMCQISVVGA